MDGQEINPDELMTISQYADYKKTYKNLERK